MNQIPQSLQGVLWSVNISKLDVKRDKAYIINQVLAFGTPDEIHWLITTYGKDAVKQVFLNQPQKVYTKPGFTFVKNAVLNLSRTDVAEEKYVQNFY